MKPIDTALSVIGIIVVVLLTAVLWLVSGIAHDPILRKITEIWYLAALVIIVCVLDRLRRKSGGDVNVRKRLDVLIKRVD